MKLIKYLFIYFKILGIAPFEISEQPIKKNFDKRITLFKYSYVGLVYTIIVMFIFILLTICRVYFMPAILDDKTSWSSITQRIDAFLNFIGSFAVYLTYLIGQDTAVYLGNKLFSVHLNLIKFDSDYQNIKNKKRHLLLVLYFISMWLIIFTIGLFSSIKLVLQIFAYISSIIIYSSVLQYVLVLIYIDDLIKIVNEEFQKTYNIYCFDNYSSKLRKVTSPNMTQIERVCILREQCLSIYEISCSATQFYTISILACLCKIVYAIVFDMYFIIKPSITGANWIDPIVYWWSALWVILEILSVIALTRYSTIATNELNKTGNIVHQLAQHSMNNEVALQMKEFSLYLINKKFRFTAFEIFPLDSSLLQSLFGSIAMYLVILVQFQLNNNPHASNC